MAEHNQDQFNYGRRQDSGSYGQSGGFQDKWMRGEEDYPDRGEYPYNQPGGSQQQYGNAGQRRQGGQQQSGDDQRFRHQEHNRPNPGDSSQPGSHYNDQPQGQHLGFRGATRGQDFYEQSNYGQPNYGIQQRGQDFYEQGGQQYRNTNYGGYEQHQSHRGDQRFGNPVYNQGQQYPEPWERAPYAPHHYGGPQPGSQQHYSLAGYGPQQPGGYNFHPDEGQHRNPYFGVQQPAFAHHPGGFRGRGPRDYHRSEERIREDVCDRLTDDDWLDASHVQVQVQGNEVILSGEVNSREEKRRAEDVVESISGVQHVENRIRVNHQEGRGTGYDRHVSQHQYTGVADTPGKIGNESGTTNEVIRNAGARNNAGLDPNNTDRPRTRKRSDKGSHKEPGA
ncbi:BON domain-containing protein [Flaviaesturariibacter flavus]|uniref:BON domain-containing protein n=1 Tax=Flaviaesturariibacter flavus TaxID=2502780 RepID=A0A4R1BBX8_9BACT|nr:BON domain-containing protein [Flaviaesturariibacter flavus]TCJ14448.1 BON domain-containing protein [Flaviaesturariibacter flavus]